MDSDMEMKPKEANDRKTLCVYVRYRSVIKLLAFGNFPFQQVAFPSVVAVRSIWQSKMPLISVGVFHMASKYIYTWYIRRILSKSSPIDLYRTFSAPQHISLGSKCTMYCFACSFTRVWPYFILHPRRTEVELRYKQNRLPRVHKIISLWYFMHAILQYWIHCCKQDLLHSGRNRRSRSSSRYIRLDYKPTKFNGKKGYNIGTEAHHYFVHIDGAHWAIHSSV